MKQTSITTGLNAVSIREFEKFFRRYYVYPNRTIVTNYSGKATGEGLEASYIFTDFESGIWVNVQIKGLDPFTITVDPCETELQKRICDRQIHDIEYFINEFNENLNKTSFYMVFSEGRGTSLVHKERRAEKAVGSIFKDSMINLYLIFFMFSFFLILILYRIIGAYAPLILVVTQIIFILFSDRIVLIAAELRITPKYPELTLLSYHTTRQEFESLIRKGKQAIYAMKDKIYQQTIAAGLEVSCQTAHGIFEEYGIKCIPQNLTVKKINIQRIMEDVCKGFSLPYPKIGITNTYIANAAATGISPSRASILITTGLLQQLDEEELKAVLGHEMSHVKRHDPIVLFGLFIAEYLFRVYILFQYPLFVNLFFIYLIGAFTVIFFAGKFLETRADTESALITGETKAFASSLRKIGYKKLYHERMSKSLVGEWLRWDPHPPIYFRISRLETLSNVRYPLLRSIKDCLAGFYQSFTH